MAEEAEEPVHLYFASTAAEGLELIQRLPGTRMQLIVPRSMPIEEYRALREAVLRTPVDRQGDYLVTFHNPRIPPLEKVIHASTVEDLSAVHDGMGGEVVVCISENIPPGLYDEIAEEAQKRRFLVASSHPQPVHGLSPGKKALIIGGCIAVGGLFLFLLCKSKEEQSTADDLRETQSTPNLPKTDAAPKNLRNRIARACGSVIGKMLTKVLKKVAKDIAIKVQEWAEADED